MHPEAARPRAAIEKNRGFVKLPPGLRSVRCFLHVGVGNVYMWYTGYIFLRSPKNVHFSQSFKELDSAKVSARDIKVLNVEKLAERCALNVLHHSVVSKVHVVSSASQFGIPVLFRRNEIGESDVTCLSHLRTTWFGIK